MRRRWFTGAKTATGMVVKRGCRRRKLTGSLWVPGAAKRARKNGGGIGGLGGGGFEAWRFDPNPVAHRRFRSRTTTCACRRSAQVTTVDNADGQNREPFLAAKA
jgi:hypothetical protein